MKAAAPPIFMFVGHSGSGKTAVVEKLLKELTARGLRPATIKHAHHKVTLDKEGKDSWRYKKAGAVMSMLVTSNELQIVADAVDRREPAQRGGRVGPRAGPGGVLTGFSATSATTCRAG